MLMNMQCVVLGWLKWSAPSVRMVLGMVLMCKCFGGSEVVQVRIWTFQVSGSAKCVVLHGVGQPGNDAIGVMLSVTRFPTTSPWVLWDGRPISHAVLVLLLVALDLDMFHPEILVLGVCPGRCWPQPGGIEPEKKKTEASELLQALSLLQRIINW